jgi:hypothetical protein
MNDLWTNHFAVGVEAMDFFFTTVAPSMGVVLSNIQLASPFKAVLECRKRKNLGPLNPVPLAMSFVNLFGIVVYGAAIQDMFILLGVAIGILLNFLGCTTAISLLAAQGRYKEVERMERLIMTGVFWWVVVALGSVSFFPTTKICITVMGATTCVTTVLYYCSPLSTIRQVIAMQDASSLLFPMLFTNLLSATLWFSYGLLGVDNIWIYLPNACGLGVTILQLFVKAYYTLWSPNLKRRDAAKSRMIDPSIPNSSDPVSEDVAIISAANSIMGMGLGGLGGIGGVGVPELSEVELTSASDASKLSSVYLNTKTQHGYDVVGIISECTSSAASALYAVAEDVGALMVSPFVDTAEEAKGKAIIISQSQHNYVPQTMSTCGVVLDYPDANFGPEFSEDAIPVGGQGGRRVDNYSNFSQFSDGGVEMEGGCGPAGRISSETSLKEEDVVSPFHNP